MHSTGGKLCQFRLLGSFEESDSSLGGLCNRIWSFCQVSTHPSWGVAEWATLGWSLGWAEPQEGHRETLCIPQGALAWGSSVNSVGNTSQAKKNLLDWGEELEMKILQRERTRPRAGKFRLKSASSPKPCLFTSPLCFTERISILRTQSDLIYLWSNCRNKNKMQPQGITP